MRKSLEQQYLELKAENDLSESKLFKTKILKDVIVSLTNRLDEMHIILAEKHPNATKADFDKITDVFKANYRQVMTTVKLSAH